MLFNPAQRLRLAKRIHAPLLWLALLALVLFVVSALTHPLMVWTGPKAEKFFAPSMQLNAEQAAAIPQILQQQGIQKALLVKAVASEQGPLLQVTTSERLPRRYFRFDNLLELKGYDKEHAQWLARFYLGQHVEGKDIASVEFIDEFSPDYPWVNRLLPVYKVTFSTDQSLSAIVYTETNALAAVSNDWKAFNRSIFQLFHTYSWLDEYPIVRIAIGTLLLSTLLMMLASGFIMLVGIRRNKNNTTATSIQWPRKLHRKLAWLALLPFFGLLFSGVYHLYQHEFSDNYRGMRMAKPMQLSFDNFSPTLNMQSVQHKPLNAMSLIQYQQQFYYRLSLSPSKKPSPSRPHNHPTPSQPEASNKQRFDGLSSEASTVYIDAVTGEVSPLSDAKVAKQLALEFFNVTPSAIKGTQHITRFGPDYDFRNKRLPVYQIQLNTDNADQLFIDPSTGILVDRLVWSQRLENYSFSLLHKWNFLRPLTGRAGRDALLTSFLFALMTLAVLGVCMRKRKNRAH